MNINYPETIIKKSNGINDSESYLSKLCEKTFLYFWSYPNIYRNQGRYKDSNGELRGGGKEVCDLLVVFEEHVFIFSDKECEFTNKGDIQIAWKRWYKKAIEKSADQIFGAERWILNTPEELYVDSLCEQPFPLLIPSKEEAKIHRIIVAHGSKKECIKHFKGGSGSLMHWSHLTGEEHKKKDIFAVGQVNPLKGYIHVFDDITLEVILNTLDTITDFTRYLEVKEEFYSKGKHIMACGEEDLLAHYLQTFNKDNEHVFLKEENENATSILIEEGMWDEYINSKNTLNQISENEVSYFWDELISSFMRNVMAGTSYKMYPPDLKEQEKIFRFLAKENRTRRRMLSKGFLEVIKNTPSDKRACRTLIPSESEPLVYVFLLLPNLYAKSYDEYREARQRLLFDQMQATKIRYKKCLDIIGFATETGDFDFRSEDFAYIDCRIWTEADYEQAIDSDEFLRKISQDTERKIIYVEEFEYPNFIEKKHNIIMKGRNRNEPCPCGSGKKYKKCCGRYAN